MIAGQGPGTRQTNDQLGRDPRFTPKSRGVPQTLGIGPQTLKNFRLVLSRSEVREAGASFQRQAQAHGEVQVAATPNQSQKPDGLRPWHAYRPPPIRVVRTGLDRRGSQCLIIALRLRRGCTSAVTAVIS